MKRYFLFYTSRFPQLNISSIIRSIGNNQFRLRVLEKTVNKFNHRYYANQKVRRGLGFDKPELNPSVNATCGCVSDESFEHSGFTGTYTWADPKSGIVYVFLSNRVYPYASNRGLINSNVRTKIQQTIQDAIIN